MAVNAIIYFYYKLCMMSLGGKNWGGGGGGESEALTRINFMLGTFTKPKPKAITSAVRKTVSLNQFCMYNMYMHVLCSKILHQ